MQASMLSFLLGLLLCLGLSGCFVPDKYYAVLTLSDKSYKLEFIGEMCIMAYYTPAMQDASVNKEMALEQILTEFKRVIGERKPTTFELRSVAPERFQTKFSYTSPYGYPEASGLFNFHIDDKTLTVTSRHINAEEQTLLHKYSIPSKGTLCIKTYGRVLESNAHAPTNILQQCSTWHMENLDENVKMVIRFANSLEVN